MDYFIVGRMVVGHSPLLLFRLKTLFFNDVYEFVYFIFRFECALIIKEYTMDVVIRPFAIFLLILQS